MSIGFLIPLLMFFSFSARTPKIQPNPQDKEYSIGAENKYYQTNFLYERENGKTYCGDRVFIKPASWIEFEHYRKEAYDIDNTSIRLLYRPFDAILLNGLRIGGSANWQHYDDLKYLGVLTFKIADINVAWESNFEDRTAFSYKAGIPLPVDTGNVTIHFYTEKQITNERASEQNKIMIGYNFKREDK